MLKNKYKDTYRKTATKVKEHGIPLSLLSLTWIAFFSRTLAGNRVYFLDDLKIIYYPLEHIYAQFQSQFQLPLWSQYFGFGQPLIAWGQLGFFTPIHVVLRLFGTHPLVLLQISILIYFLIGLIGTYIFFISRKFSQSSATLGAVLFVFTGFTVGHLNHVNFYTATMLLPWLLFAIHLFLQKPTLRRAAIMAILAAIIPLSGQPQISLYTLGIATSVGIAMLLGQLGPNRQRPQYWSRVISYTILAIVLALGLASLAILPLSEFLPQTERAAGIDTPILYEFSYPPSHAITLIMPYFFGGHDNYWGAKGFQELAAFTGIIPLLLAGAALTNWKKYRTERVVGLVLVATGIMLALAKFSPLYIWLVEEHVITSLSVPGRFVYFFLFGVILLAISGFDDMLAYAKTRSVSKKTAALITGYLLTGILFVSFLKTLIVEPPIRERMTHLLSTTTIELWLIGIGVLILPALVFVPLKKHILWIRNWTIPTIVAITLIAYGWNYNPLTPTSQAFKDSPFVDTLAQFNTQDQRFARLYSHKALPLDGINLDQEILTERISPFFTVHQPIEIKRNEDNCTEITLQAERGDKSTIEITVRDSLNGAVVQEHTLSTEQILRKPGQTFCINPQHIATKSVLSFSSEDESSVQLMTTPESNPDKYIYYVRVKNPTQDQLTRSQKPFSLKVTSTQTTQTDQEAQLLARHLNALASTSSARWIGALSIRPYREFVDYFFANDTDQVIDGEGVHTLVKNRTLLDMAGVTHLAQSLKYDQQNDPVLTQGYLPIHEYDTGKQMLRLYENPTAYPKVFLSTHARFKSPADEIRFALSDPTYNPREYIFVSGPKPPTLSNTPPTTPLEGTATITRYEPTLVEVKTNTNQDSFLVVTDSTTEQWQTFIDDKPVERLIANSVFKATELPAGTHTVTFKYESSAVKTALVLTVFSIALLLLLLYSPPLTRGKK